MLTLVVKMLIYVNFEKQNYMYELPPMSGTVLVTGFSVGLKGQGS